MQRGVCVINGGGTGDLVVAGHRGGITFDAVVNERALAPAGTGAVPFNRHLVAADVSAPVGLRQQVERGEASGLRTLAR